MPKTSSERTDVLPGGLGMRRFVAPSTALLAVAALLPIVAAPRASAASGTVTGRVFQDYNSNGAYDTTVAEGVAVDIGLGGVIVRAYDSGGALVGQTTTASNGTYTLNATLAATTDVRIEFDHLASDDLEGFAPSFAGADSGTTVQFVTLPATGVDLGLNRPDEYCQNNPNISVTRQCFGVDGSGIVYDVGAAPTIWVTRYDGGPYTTANGFTNLYNNWSATQAGTHSQTRSIMGLAWDKRSGRLISSALVRRNVALHEVDGKPRPGALFTTVPNGRTATATGGSTQFLVDLEELLPGDQFSNLTPPPAGVANAGFTGYIPTNAARGVPNGADSDILAGTDGVYEEAGKTGIGDIDADDDGNLYVVSLYDKNLYKVALPANGSAPTTMTSIGALDTSVTCTNGEARPYGIEIWRGAVYAGVVCDGSADYSPAAPNAVDDRNLTFSIKRYDLDGGSWSVFLGPYPLHAAVSGAPFKGSPVTSDVDPSESNVWNAWTDRFSTTWERGSWPPVRPVPMLADIEFDRDGSLILGFRDRTIDQNPTGVLYPDGSPGRLNGLNAGDVMRICRTGTGYAPADYTIQGQTGCLPGWDNGSVATTDDEWYRDDYGDPGHYDNSAGLTEYVPGFPDVMHAAMDPYNAPPQPETWSAGGIQWLLNSNGGIHSSINAGGGVLFFSGPTTPPNNLGSFNKANGMGDIEALCDEAPVQIGNRLWFDEDRDGIQDPGEEPIVGATVRLYDADGVVVGTAVTNAAGEYFFESSLSEAAAGNGDARGGGLEPGEPFTVRMDNPADYAAGGPLSGLVLTDTSGSTPVGSDQEGLIDSDGSPSGSGAFGSGSFPQVAVPALEPGVNDHSFDVGFVRPVVAVGDFVWVDEDRDGVQDVGEPPLQWTKVELFNADGTRARDADGELVDPVYTDAAGRYLFDNLSPGDYRVKFTPPNPAVSSFTDDLVGGGGADSDADQLTGLSEVFTLAAAVTGDMVADTDPATVASYVNPTIDAGVVLGVRVGNRVWVDADGDGVQDPEDRGLGGATVTLTDMAGNPVVDLLGRPVGPQVTDAEGRYLFSNLPPGQYRTTVTYPAGTFPTRAGVGDPGSDSSTTTAVSRVLAAGEQDLTLDFGVVTGTVAVGDRVWVDGNRDGRQSPGERGLAGARLLLFNADGTRARDVTGRLVPARVTGRDGKYLFSNLPPGQYVTRITYPRGWTRTTVGVGPRETDSAGRRARSLVLVAGERDLTLDFGVVPVRRLARTI